MGGQYRIAESQWLKSPFFQMAQQDHIAQGARHLDLVLACSLMKEAAADIDKLAVHPVLNRRFAAHPLALLVFLLVMLKDQIDTAGMDIALIAPVFGSHSRAIYLPA